MATEKVCSDEVFVSIQLNSNRPDQIGGFLESVETTASRPSCVEVLIHIDDGDDAMEETLRSEIQRRALKIKWLKTRIVSNFFDLWKPLNALLKLTDPHAYFVFNCSDEFRFLTPGWDDILRRYVGYYPDHIFRIRASRYRYRNYVDIWQCGFAPDSLTFYTKRWLDIVEDWNPCLGPDSFQQCIAYYLQSADPFNSDQDFRDIPEPVLAFSGEGASLGLTGDAYKERVRGHIRAWFVIASHSMQQEAKRRAMLLKAHIWAAKNNLGTCYFHDDDKRCCIIAISPSILEPRSFSYRLSPWKLAWRNNLRKLQFQRYMGIGHQTPNPTFIHGVLYYLCYKSRHIERLVDFVRSRTILRRPGIERRIKNWQPSTQLSWLDTVLADGRRYYIYGTGEFARQLFLHIQSRRLPYPSGFIERESILATRTDSVDWDNIPVVSDASIVASLTKADRIIIGSYTYRYDVVERLRQSNCMAKVINVYGS